MSKNSENLFVNEISNMKLSFNSNDSFCIDEKFELGDSHKEFYNVHADSTKDIDLIDDKHDARRRGSDQFEEKQYDSNLLFT